jgi:TetR/AcrR family transcriptional repressor of nem operon
MARPQKYNQPKVLNAASDLFNLQGYRATSIDQLLEVTKLSRSSLYHGFGNKEAVYLMVMDHIAAESAVLYKDLANEHGPEAFLRLFFQCYHTDTLARSPGKGCLLVNTVVELSDSEPVLVDRAIGYLNLAEQSLAIYFKNAQKNGQLANHQNPKSLAKFFMNTKKGLMVSLRHGTPLKELTEVIETSLQLLK